MHQYVEGGSDLGLTAAANLRAFAELSAVPRILRDVATGTTSLRLPGATLPSPIGLAPVAHQGLFRAGAEVETARAAQAVGALLIASTLSTRTLEEIAAVAGTAPRWFQLYLQPVRTVSDDLVRRAANAGYSAIVVTVDAALQAPNRAAVALGFRMPEDLRAGNLRDYPSQAEPVPGADVFTLAARHGVVRSDLERVRELTPLPIWVKGVLHPDDAVAIREGGFAGIIVSNHGGRSLDGVIATLRVLPEVRAAVGDDFPVLVDGGIRSGMDVFKALASGADAVLVGRLQAYALAVAGALGVAHLLRTLTEELQLAMAMTGCEDLAAVRSALLR